MVSDMTGEQPISVLISSVTSEEEGVVTCSDETRHNLESGDYVTFSEVQVRGQVRRYSDLQVSCGHLVKLRNCSVGILRGVDVPQSSLLSPSLTFLYIFCRA